MNQSTYHIPALLEQSLAALDVQPDGVYIDCTYGGGGHSKAIVKCLDAEQGGHLYAFDQDRDAVKNAIDDKRFTMILSNFRYLENFMAYHDVDKVDGVLADLGVSFHHFDDPERGFSFRWPEGSLDMRMNRMAGRSAADIVNTCPAEELTRIFRLYGEMKRAPQIAAALIQARQKEPITTVSQFLDIIRSFINPRQEKKELAQIFQALRIEVNDELGALRAMLNAALKVLRPGGRLAVITYHSLEDRLVKNFMKTGNMEGTDNRDLFGNSSSPMRMLGSKPIVPTQAETDANPRSRSAKLRTAVKL
ncbi:MAG: 16S rRNA (cytosine(1402)-N(4))-methyltransferase RsmH [Bacteroidales bacterium]|nr:16S rRNA (cytosine(1402)-N(4))-methyltransferase RsmH [Bacteroidales bacterium]